MTKSEESSISTEIDQQTTECVKCNREIRRNQAFIGYGLEYKNFARKNGFEDDDELIFCKECESGLEKVNIT